MPNLSSYLSLSSYPGGSSGKESACNEGDLCSIPGLGRSPGEGKGNPLQYSGLDNYWTVQSMGSQRGWTRLSDFYFHLSLSANQKRAQLTWDFIIKFINTLSKCENITLTEWGIKVFLTHRYRGLIACILKFQSQVTSKISPILVWRSCSPSQRAKGSIDLGSKQTNKNDSQVQILHHLSPSRA